jgi:hypothetical protein
MVKLASAEKHMLDLSFGLICISKGVKHKSVVFLIWYGKIIKKEARHFRQASIG